MSKIYFTKMHSLGNDFMIINNLNNRIILSLLDICSISDRNTGVGFDQLLLLERSNNYTDDFYYRIFNSNGTEAMQCGNGACCLSQFLYKNRFTTKRNIIITTKKSIVLANIIGINKVKLSIGKPDFYPRNILDKIKLNKSNLYSMKINQKNFLFSLVFIGNYHCIIKVNNINSIQVEKIGLLINKSKLFKKQINITFMQVISNNYIKLRIYEVGCGETLSCGSASCAAVAVGIQHNYLSKLVKVELPGGKLFVSWSDLYYPIIMYNETKYVYDGVLNC
ncbi:MAG: diaminopimelate epimerase [Candidatus Lightella neohaematopini]|nr:diaminopimelate epimerase [Candidatus Lightella neohaematopini]MCV2529067.1 diaminopimelate epimerase [Candidatus Lightella neohaematopini]